MPFHSAQPAGKPPTWYELPPIAQGSAIRSTPAAAAVGARRQLADDAVQRVARVHLVEVEAAVLAGVAEHRGQIEAEAIDAQGVAPVGEGVDDQVLRDRVVVL
jgi:hypothetical protein